MRTNQKGLSTKILIDNSDRSPKTSSGYESQGTTPFENSSRSRNYHTTSDLSDGSWDDFCSEDLDRDPSPPPSRPSRQRTQSSSNYINPSEIRSKSFTGQPIALRRRQCIGQPVPTITPSVDQYSDPPPGHGRGYGVQQLPTYRRPTNPYSHSIYSHPANGVFGAMPHGSGIMNNRGATIPTGFQNTSNMPAQYPINPAPVAPSHPYYNGQPTMSTSPTGYDMVPFQQPLNPGYEGYPGYAPPPAPANPMNHLVRYPVTDMTVGPALAIPKGPASPDPEMQKKLEEAQKESENAKKLLAEREKNESEAISALVTYKKELAEEEIRKKNYEEAQKRVREELLEAEQRAAQQRLELEKRLAEERAAARREMEESAKKALEEKMAWEKKIAAEREAIILQIETARKAEEKAREEKAKKEAEEKAAWERKLDEEKRRVLLEAEEAQRAAAAAKAERERKEAEEKAAWQQKLEEEKRRVLLEAEEAARAAAVAKAEQERKEAEEKAAWQQKLDEEKRRALFEYEEAQKAAAAALAAQAKKDAEAKEALEQRIEEERKAAAAKALETLRKNAEAEAKKAAEIAAEEKKKADAQAELDRIKKEAADEAAKLKEEAAKLKKEGEEAAEKLRKEKEEAAEKYLKEKEEAAEKHRKEQEEAAEKHRKEQEEALAKAMAPPPEDKKKPIRFKDAVGRKFSLPFDLCSTWAGMEELIKQAFKHVAVIGPHVAEGHYDLIGPDGEYILPKLWETMIEPDLAITMQMWNMPDPPSGASAGEAASADKGQSKTAPPPPPPPPPQQPPLPRPQITRPGGPPVIVMPPKPRKRPGETKTNGVLNWVVGRPIKSTKGRAKKT